MKNRNLAILALGITLLATSCKKSDVNEDTIVTNDQTTPVVGTTTAKWKTVTNWETTTENESTTYQSKIEDASITTAVASDGLVLVFASNGKNIEALPYEQKAGADTYAWYYQVSEGMISLSAETRSAAKNSFSQSVRYFVLTPEQVKDLEAKGISEASLMEMNYQQAETTLKNL